MSERHPDRAQIVALLETGRAAPEVERHLARCDACARLLEEEARLEEALFEVAERRSARPSASGWALAVIAAVASVLLLLGTVGAERTREPSAPTTVHVGALDGGAPDGGPPAP